MIVSFGSQRLLSTCLTRKNMVKTYGPEMAKKVEVRLALLKNAKSMAELQLTRVGRFHELKGERKGQYAQDLIKLKRLIFVPATAPCPRLPDGGVDLAKVDSVCVVEIGDYH